VSSTADWADALAVPATAAAAALLTTAALRGLRAYPPGGATTWRRSNHRGREVTLLAGPALVLGAASTAAAGTEGRWGRAALVAGLGAGAFGLYDDLYGGTASARAVARGAMHVDRGFRGHLRALRTGRVSTGLVKVVGIGAAGLLAARALTRSPLEQLVAGGVVAGTANLLNLLDLRPGRAAKAAVVLGLPLLRGPGAPLAAGVVGAAVAVLPGDLAEQTMLGDTGANALGALLGLALAARCGPAGRAGVLAGLVLLTAASERISFTAVIEATPGLRELDALGRAPARG